MASILKAQKANAKDVKGKGKRRADEMDVDAEERAGPVAGEDAVVAERKVKKNKQRVLLLSSRGVTQRMRHLMADIEALLPHVKKGVLLLLFPARSWG